MVDGIAAAVDVATDTTQQPSVCSITSTAASRRSANRLPSSGSRCRAVRAAHSHPL